MDRDHNQHMNSRRGQNGWTEDMEERGDTGQLEYLIL